MVDSPEHPQADAEFTLTIKGIENKVDWWREINPKVFTEIIVHIVGITTKSTLEIPIVIVYVMTRGCCLLCGHCSDEIIAEMMDCKCDCHA